MPGLVSDLGLAPSALGNLTSAVQLGFILGTLGYALGSVADRFRPSRVFFVSAVLAAACNGLVTLLSGEAALPLLLLLLRFGTGFFLAGIYPVGMKIAADHFDKGLGRALGFLVGALVLGTAFPHLLGSLGRELDWRGILYATSGLALSGGLLLLLLVPEGPYRKAGAGFRPGGMFRLFRSAPFRAAAFGYFGHMWELYAFWAFVPVMLEFHRMEFAPELNVSLWSFLAISAGALACMVAGLASLKLGAGKSARFALSLSGLCCLASPFMLVAPGAVFLPFLLFWGMVVVADSPMFSTLVARHAPAENRGAALTIVNSIGFAITILSIQLCSFLQSVLEPEWVYVALAIGPAFGLYAVRRAA